MQVKIKNASLPYCEVLQKAYDVNALNPLEGRGNKRINERAVYFAITYSNKHTKT